MKRCLDVMVVEGIKTNIPCTGGSSRTPTSCRALRHPLHGAVHAAEKGERGLVRGAGTPSRAGLLALCPAGRRAAPGPLAPSLLVPTALLPDLAAALPLRTYFFRDFTVTFLPLRLFAARELREAGSPCGTPGSSRVLPAAGPVPARPPARAVAEPVFVSWLLTLHLPMPRSPRTGWRASWERRARAPFQSGAVFALGGFALSCLNLYVFLQALALAPFWPGSCAVPLAGRPARPGRGLVLAVAASTVAIEFVAQAVLLGSALGLVASPRGQSLGRLLAAIALGVGCGAAGGSRGRLLPETVRGAGLATDVVLGNAVHPCRSSRRSCPTCSGCPSPAEAWWGGRFFSKGLPYFLSLLRPADPGPGRRRGFALRASPLRGDRARDRGPVVRPGGGAASAARREAPPGPHPSGSRPRRCCCRTARGPGLGFGVDRLRAASRAWVRSRGCGGAAAVALAVAAS